METLFIYFIKSSALITLFFLVYHLLLRKETFFNTNRWFLLMGLVVSAVLPLFFIKKIVYIESTPMNWDQLVQLPQSSSTVVSQTAEATPINWFQVGFWVYGIVALLLLIKVIYNSFSLFKTLHKRTIHKTENFSLVDVEEDIAPFSFFNFIVFNSKLYTENELQNILSHEKIHSSQKHSIDVLFTKLFSIVFWFNPFMQLYKKAIVQNLEYIADQKAIEVNDKKLYQLTLLKVVSHQNCLPITNHFYQSLIKKRIVMLNKNQSHKRNSWKYTVVIPALIAFVFLFQIKTVAQEREIVKVSQNSKSGIYITTDKNTTDAEMKKDAAFAKEKYGVTLKFSKVKRNANGEITGIKVTYKDKDGNTGTTQFDGNEPIKPIYFYKTPTKIGFGKSNSVIVYSGNGSDDVIAEKELNFKMKDSMDFDIDIDVDIDEDEIQKIVDETTSKIVIQKDGKKPLIMIDGKVIELGEGFSDGEIDELKKGFAYQFNNGQLKMLTDLNIEKIKGDALDSSLEQLKRIRPEIMKQIEGQMIISKDQMEKARVQMERAIPQIEKEMRIIEKNSPEFEKARAEMEKARAEMMKAKADMEKAKAELEKAKAELRR
ncbi:M56 family metallopeptidase [Flavobacterium sp.]|uniref:M56 family metallopeptidase n=1 Tax=Flavobacterium sp. TaxID=239 RepID=UPI002B4ACC3B|nr:M56 family metallopeptidase [Flavobacterium sp.]HLP64852.1 M56 family metallopeptidase [Flavobacterium sp.]